MRTSSKITLSHLSRRAVVYIRQSTTRQVKFNEESTMRQYALKDLLIEYGWDGAMIDINDEDLGISAKFSENRAGFMRLVGDVANGTVGAIACIEASRLSRSSSDWARIIDYCAMTQTLIIDEDAVYDPRDPNDRLLLGVKGSLTELELHNIRARMQGGLINKVKRGELKIKIPLGYAYDPLGRIIMDPNKSIQDAVHQLFSVFSTELSVYGTVCYFRNHEMLFPSIARTGLQKGELSWVPLTTVRALTILKHPIYCGRYVYGRTEVVTTPMARQVVRKGVEEWMVDIHDHHPAYISEETYQRNQMIIRQNSHIDAEIPSTPGRGNALLQGIVYCGRCGKRMFTGYQISSANNKDWAFPLYICEGGNQGNPPHQRCMTVNGTAIDEKISFIVEERLTEEAVRNAIEVKKEVEAKWGANERILQRRVELAEYEASLMRKRYMNCDPENALVRIDLEKAYNEALAVTEEARRVLEAERKRHTAESEAIIEGRLVDLVSDFSKVWGSPDTDIKVKKKLIRSLIQSITLYREGNSGICSVKILYTGGETEEFEIPCTCYGPNTVSWKVWDYLREHGTEYTAAELAEQLNKKGLTRAVGGEWTANSVTVYMHGRKIKTKEQHYRDMGYMTIKELAAKIGITPQSILKRHQKGYYAGTYVWVTEYRYLFAPCALLLDAGSKAGTEAQ